MPLWRRGRPQEDGEGSGAAIASPDILGVAPTGAHGVRRLGVRITLVLGAVAAILLIWVYLALDAREQRTADRARRPAAAAAAQQATAKGAGLGLDGPLRQGVFPAAGSAVPGGAGPPATEAGADGAWQLSQAAPEGPYAQTWRSYYAARAEREQADYARRVTSISAPATVPAAFKAPAARPEPGAAASYADLLRSQPPPPAPIPIPERGGPSGWTGRDEEDGPLARTVRPSRGRTELKAGTVINAVLLSGLDSDLPGMIQGQVTRDVFDTVSGSSLLIPQGSRLLGRYNSNIGYGQGRVQVAWNRIIFPDGASIDLVAMPGADQAGGAGFADKVDNHYGRLFGAAIAVSAFGAAAQLSQPHSSLGDGSGGYSYSPGQTAAGEVGRQLGQLGTEVTRKQLQVQPTLRIRAGYRFTVVLTRDVMLPVWKEN